MRNRKNSRFFLWIYIITVCLMLTLAFAGCKIIDEKSPLDGTKVNTTPTIQQANANKAVDYSIVLTEYQKALSGTSDHSYDYVSETWTSLNWMSGTIGDVYYTLHDLNGDDVEELFIAEILDQPNYFDIFTYDGEKPIRIIDDYSLGYRAYLTLFEDNTFLIEFGSGAAYYEAAFYRLPPNSSAAVEIERFGEEMNAYYHTDVFGNRIQITQEEYFAGIDTSDLNECVLSWTKITVPDTSFPEATEAPAETTNPYLNIIGAGRDHTVYLRPNGTACAAGLNGDGQTNVENWIDVISVCAGDRHSLGLTSDGYVYAVGKNNEAQCDVSYWKNISVIAAGDYHSVGITSDGYVYATGRNNYGQCDTAKMMAAAGNKKIISVAAGMDHTVVLLEDGTCAAVGSNAYGQIDVSSWTDIVQVYAATYHTIGLHSDGTAVAVGSNQYGQLNVSEWIDLVALSAGDDFSLGLKSDGTVVGTGWNFIGQIDVANWKDIVSIGGGSNHSVGLKEDGTLVFTGRNDMGQCDLQPQSNP